MNTFEQQAEEHLRNTIKTSIDGDRLDQPSSGVENTTQENFTQKSSDEGQKFSDSEQSADIVSSDPESVSDDPIDNLISNTFGGDPKKIAKSYIESQRAYTTLQSQLGERDSRLQKYESQFQQLDNLLNRYPELANQVEQAIQGKYESRPEYRQEPQGKPTPYSQSGKLDNSNTLPTEQTLINAGYLDATDRNNLSTLDYQQRLLQAQYAYMSTELPNQIMQQTMNKLQEQQQQQRAYQQQQQIEQLNNQRFSDSFDKAVAKFGINFSSTHAHLFDEITDHIKAYRDPKNMGLIAEDAVELATERVLRAHDMLPSGNVSKPAFQQPAPSGDNGFMNSRQTTVSPQPNDFMSNYQRSLADKQLQDLQRRNQTRMNMRS